MGYKVVWSAFAEQVVDDIFEYYLNETQNYDIALRIITEILTAPNILKNHPLLGPAEEELRGRRTDYRYLAVSNYKIIYSVDDAEKLIKIADVFDTHQYPEKIKRKK